MFRWCAMNSAKQRHPKGNEPGNLSGSRNSWTIINMSMNMSWTCHEHFINISLTLQYSTVLYGTLQYSQACHQPPVERLKLPVNSNSGAAVMIWNATTALGHRYLSRCKHVQNNNKISWLSNFEHVKSHEKSRLISHCTHFCCRIISHHY